jgi:hypothetical protein
MPFVAVAAVLVAASPGPAATHHLVGTRHLATDTLVYRAGGKLVGRITSYGAAQTPGGQLVAYWTIRPHGVVLFSQGYCTTYCGYGYARMRPGETWYVEAFFAEPPRVRTIGTVRRRSASIWDAYRGLGPHAHHAGWAEGTRAPIGAAALLTVRCWCE